MVYALDLVKCVVLFYLPNNSNHKFMSNTPNRTIIKDKAFLIGSIFIAGLCSIIYELLISTTSSYFLGDSIRQFSLTIGFYMAAMGIGSFLSRLFKTKLLQKFIGVEILLGLIGGASVPILYFVYAFVDYTGFMYYTLFLVVIIGILTGLEVPLLMRVMEEYDPLEINLSNVLSMDYLGALLATLLFPFILLPLFGTFQTSVFFGLVNVSLGILNLWYFSDHLSISKRRVLLLAAGFVMIVFFGMLSTSKHLLAWWNNNLYQNTVVYSKQTPYQNIILTKGKKDLRLYLNGVIQFSSMDEYRYHESLVHIPMSQAPYRKNILILGGGEGLLSREVLKYKSVESVTVVDLDPAMFELATKQPQLVTLNHNSMADARVKLVPQDAFVFLQESEQLYDVILADLPDPTTEGLARLYSDAFFKLVRKRLVPQGVFATQASSPYHTKKAYWCIGETLKTADFSAVLPYHTYVPSFGDWGFWIAAPRLAVDQIDKEIKTEYLEDTILPATFYFQKDLRVDSIMVNTLDHPVLLDYYMEGWRKWGQIK